MPEDIDKKLEEFEKSPDKIKLDLVKKYENKLNKAIPFTLPVEIKDEERPVIKKEISIKIPAKATNRLIDTTELRIEENKYGVQLTKNESGCWVADIKDKSKGNHKTHSHSFTSKKTGDDGYHEAAAWGTCCTRS